MEWYLYFANVSVDIITQGRAPLTKNGTTFLGNT